MSILIRYLIKSHIGPFLFSFTLLTGLLFLNSIAQRLDQLFGKGLPWQLLASFAVLTLPHTVALTLPMSVLVAVLYAFSDLTAENEVTAMTSGGINPIRIVLPLVGIGVILAGGMLMFNDKVLPEANHSLKNLMVDISRKSPTFQLREEVMNEVVAEDENRQFTYFLRAQKIDPVTSELEGITVYDLSDGLAERTTHAERGKMAFNEEQTDLYLTLYDGEVFEVPTDQVGGFRRIRFIEQVLPLRGVADLLERSAGLGYRSDREKSIEMLGWDAMAYDEDRREVMEESRIDGLYTIKRALGWTTEGDSMVPPRRAAAEEMAQGGGSGQEVVAAASAQQSSGLPPDDVTRSAVMNIKTSAAKEENARLNAIRNRLEIHKKYAISFVCIVFVIIGAPLAVRFPRGGVGMVITVSVTIFAIFWMFLIGGETLADRGYMGPALAMWMPNLILLPIGLVLLSRMSRLVATARGGGWDDLLFTLTNWVGRAFASVGRSKESRGGEPDRAAV
jgi:lipopolysaccharide export system permease protein